MKQITEHRSYPRAVIDLEVEIRLENANDSFYAKTHDISATGVCIISDLEVSEGDIIALSIDLKDLKRRIPVKAHVRRIWEKDGKPYLSAQFMDIDYNDFIFILDYSLEYGAKSV